MRQGKTKNISTIFGLSNDVVAILFLFIGMGFFVFPHTVFAEVNDNSYRSVLHETIRFYNFFTDEKISPEQEALMAWGVRHEGIPSRAIHHDSPESIRAWAHDARAQSDYAYEGIYTWEQGIDDYARGDEQRAFEVLGHLLRLVFEAESLDDAFVEDISTELRADEVVPTPLSTFDDVFGTSGGDLLTAFPNAAGIMQRFFSEAEEKKNAVPKDARSKKIQNEHKTTSMDSRFRGNDNFKGIFLQSQNIFMQIATWTQHAITLFRNTSKTVLASVPSFSFGRDAIAVDRLSATTAAANTTPPSESPAPSLTPSPQLEIVTPISSEEPPRLPFAQSVPIEVVISIPLPDPEPEPPPPPIFQQAGEVVSLPPPPSIELPPPLPQTDYLGFPIGYVPRSSSDRTAPDTAITVSPDSLTTVLEAIFSFDATEQSTFSCVLDGGNAVECTSPKTYSDFTLGEHTFSVFARDSAGNDDTTPATFAWTIQVVPPPPPAGGPPPNPEPEAPPVPEPPPAPEPEVPPEPEPEPEPEPPPAVAIIKITDAHFQGNASVEYMVITNQGSASQDFLGWKLHDIVATPSHTYTFGAFTLAVGATVTVHTGAGTNTQTDIYWNSNISIWNDTGGDTAFLKDSSGALIDSVTW